MSSEPLIHVATIADIPGILAVAAQHLLVNKSDKSAAKLESGGFLLHQFTATELQAILQDHENFINVVLKQQGEIIGYAITCKILQWHALHPVWQTHITTTADISNIVHSDKTLYGYQGAVKIGHKGVGRQLLPAVFDRAISKGYQFIICEIVHKPFRNRTSVLYHRRMGFQLIGTSKNHDFITGVYLKRL